MNLLLDKLRKKQKTLEQQDKIPYVLDCQPTYTIIVSVVGNDVSTWRDSGIVQYTIVYE